MERPYHGASLFEILVEVLGPLKTFGEQDLCNTVRLYVPYSLA